MVLWGAPSCPGWKGGGRDAIPAAEPLEGQGETPHSRGSLRRRKVQARCVRVRAALQRASSPPGGSGRSYSRARPPAHSPPGAAHQRRGMPGIAPAHSRASLVRSPWSVPPPEGPRRGDEASQEGNGRDAGRGAERRRRRRREFAGSRLSEPRCPQRPTWAFLVRVSPRYRTPAPGTPRPPGRRTGRPPMGRRASMVFKWIRPLLAPSLSREAVPPPRVGFKYREFLQAPREQRLRKATRSSVGRTI
ncbi:unnamed protein product [Rangifer tarandus platyrhynchus]|uniref:Uncharacterized protein n=1 Tax=Rangifer tarandus platyrhynchus TaxID=3082113 RepID=A0ABN8Z4X9_RANTA|nr:unnamed protein product [Rangifer tarandus platyrhynchus]